MKSNRTQRRTSRRARRHDIEIRRLRKACLCQGCRQSHRRWPANYVGGGGSPVFDGRGRLRAGICYECHLERQQAIAPQDERSRDELKEFLAELFNEHERMGAILIQRTGPKPKNLHA